MASVGAKADPAVNKGEKLAGIKLLPRDPPLSSTVVNSVIDAVGADPFCFTQNPFICAASLPIFVICRYATGTDWPARAVPPESRGTILTSRVVLADGTSGCVVETGAGTTTGV